MIEAVTDAKKYFQAPQNYFWKWGDNGEVIEWKNGTTICYRDELIGILNDLSNEGFPPVSPLLLILSACREAGTLYRKMCLYNLMKEPGNESEEQLKSGDRVTTKVNFGSTDAALRELIDDTIDFMDIINSLPENLRTGKARIHLIYEVFEKSGFVFSKYQLQDAVNELNSGRLDRLIINGGAEINKEQFKTELEYLRNAFQRFPTHESLVLKLRTGLHDIPDPIPVSLPETSPLDLFDQLAEDPKTIGISRLAKRLIAALNIPMHSQGSGDQSYGGISDITNRGNYDKLLLSELAHDDVSLTARLVNNEALYYRREEPPDNPKRQRTILLDTTLKMWGIPRVFALSAALACTQNTKHEELVEAYALGGEQCKSIELGTKEGIIQSQEILDHSLHCGKALLASIDEIITSEQNDVIFITDASLLNSPDFLAYFSQVKESLSFILTVSRSGELQFYECIKGRTKLLSTARFDLEELLFAKQVKRHRQTSNTDLPVFITSGCTELYFPTVGFNPTQYNVFFHDNVGVIGVTANYRILHWPLRDNGALEIGTVAHDGNCFFGYDGSGTLSIMLKNEQYQFLALCRIAFENRLMQQFSCDTDKMAEQELQHHNEYYFLKNSVVKLTRPDFRLIKKYINNGYSVLLRIENILISKFNEITLDGHCLTLTENNAIKISVKTDMHGISGEQAIKEEEQIGFSENQYLKLQKWIWPEGSELFIDSRGLLHLVSADQSIPEVTIVLSLGKTTACWASDGTACGSNYFLNVRQSTIIAVPEFYNKYIKPYIDRINGS